jgi:hypothetical protein
MHLQRATQLHPVETGAHSSSEYGTLWSIAQGTSLMRLWRTNFLGATTTDGAAAFAHWLVEMIKQPQIVHQIAPHYNLENYTISYSLALLARVRHGLTPLELCHRFEQLGLPYDLDVIRGLYRIPFFCQRDARLYLHTEIMHLLQTTTNTIDDLKPLELSTDVLFAD